MDDKKNIYIAARFLTQPITGVQRFGIEICKELKYIESKYKFEIISPYNIISYDEFKELNAKIIGKFKGSIWDQLDLFIYLIKKKNPLLICLANSSSILYRNKIITIHDIIHLKYPTNKWYKRYYKIIFPLMIKTSKHIITVSEFSRDEIHKYYNINKNKISVIYNGVSKEFKPCPKKEISEKYILGLSSIAYHKNFKALIKAFIKIKNKKIKLYIVGENNKKIYGYTSSDLYNYIEKDFKERIKFLGRVSEKELIKLYSNSICFVYPSLYEGFGIPPLEAQACGCPVLLSNIKVFKEVYKDSVIYFDPYDENDIANKIELIIENTEIKNELINKGFENARKYTWEKAARKLLEVIENNIK